MFNDYFRRTFLTFLSQILLNIQDIYKNFGFHIFILKTTFSHTSHVRQTVVCRLPCQKKLRIIKNVNKLWKKRKKNQILKKSSSFWNQIKCQRLYINDLFYFFSHYGFCKKMWTFLIQKGIFWLELKIGIKCFNIIYS